MPGFQPAASHLCLCAVPALRASDQQRRKLHLFLLSMAPGMRGLVSLCRGTHMVRALQDVHIKLRSRVQQAATRSLEVGSKSSSAYLPQIMCVKHSCSM